MAYFHQELEAWTTDFALPTTVWLAGFFNPQSFLTAIMQSMARKNEWPLDKMCLSVEVTKKNREDMTAPPREGAYVYGLFMEGNGGAAPAGLEERQWLEGQVGEVRGGAGGPEARRRPGSVARLRRHAQTTVWSPAGLVWLCQKWREHLFRGSVGRGPRRTARSRRPRGSRMSGGASHPVLPPLRPPGSPVPQTRGAEWQPPHHRPPAHAATRVAPSPRGCRAWPARARGSPVPISETSTARVALCVYFGITDGKHRHH